MTPFLILAAVTIAVIAYIAGVRTTRRAVRTTDGRRRHNVADHTYVTLDELMDSDPALMADDIDTDEHPVAVPATVEIRAVTPPTTWPRTAR